MTDLTLTTTRLIKAPAEKLFSAWLDPEMLAKFMAPGPGMSVPKAETDPKIGGRFDIVMKAGDKEIPHWGFYKEITPHERLVFTWESPFSVEGSTVTVTFTDQPEGTEVSLTHVRFPSEESRDNHDKGWTHILAVLEASV